MNKKYFTSATYLVPIAICLLAICGIVYYYFFASMSSTGKDAKFFIDKDDNIDSVICKLKPISTSAGLSGFSTIARYVNYKDKVRPGMYILKDGTSAFSFIRKLHNGQQDAIMLTIPSVRTLPDLARKLDRKLAADSAEYMKAFTDSAKIAALGYTKETLPALFIPNTYDFYWTETPVKLLERMVKEHDKFWNADRTSKAKALGMTPNEVTTLASIVDSETNIESDKPIVAGVYLNRLNIGMNLQADPTVKFAVGDFTLRRILFKHLAIDSPYNTYKYAGLPPGPICIPSISGIDAVLNAPKHEYIYFCASPKFDGTHIFAKTSEEHMKNAHDYQAALNKRNIK
ncbi:MAG: endolytic transglycosylase MltG [Prevotella sp.]|nr:endolytic transglycosylase MltG [Prevotella sp.]